MERILLDEIMDAIGRATYRGKGDKYEHLIVYGSENLSVLRTVIEKVIWEHEEKNKKCEVEIAKLSAKVFAYEAIIANSNFAPMLRNQKVLDLRLGEQE